MYQEEENGENKAYMENRKSVPTKKLIHFFLVVTLTYIEIQA